VFANLLKFGPHNQVNPRLPIAYVFKEIRRTEAGNREFEHMVSDEKVYRVMI
jgi:hypothetical protein